ncbi:hypothetical protein BD410DRAFT_788044 [Rickenella mellea]|uniref:HECT domain-containing protein n=1 Tax=Rickenella mellea TaxID=50990 RepID=A0A4Y7Q506_9AGAM|nr:hypothetical protein BD410DRAFT_788044 [Rickenella mellea]
MATLTKLRSPEASENTMLASRVPDPFPVDMLRERRFEHIELRQEEHPTNPIQESPRHEEYSSGEVSTGECTPSHVEISQRSIEQDDTRELLPSIVYVQQSCLMTLNNLFLDLPGFKDEWQPIVPNRRHSMPPTTQSDNNTADANVASSSSALQTLVSNLRNYDNQQMLETSSTSDDAALIRELRRRVQDISFNLSTSDARLAQALTSLLSHLHRLSVVDPKTVGDHESSADTSQDTRVGSEDAGNLYDDLTRQLSVLQLKRSNSDVNISSQASPVLSVEIALLWTKVDLDLDTVLTLCRQRTDSRVSWMPENAPPEYDAADYDMHFPPEYDGTLEDSSQFDVKTLESSSATLNNAVGMSEKMKLDLDAVTMAIDRLYLVAPQLHNQRVELKTDKRRELERARLAGPSTTTSKTSRLVKERKDTGELDKIVDLIGKASSRRMVEQSAVLEGDPQRRLERARQRDSEKREAFVEKLIRHSDAGRLHSQDAALQSNKTRNPNALLTLPDFLREQVPEHLRIPDPEALLTLPEFVKEPPPSDHSEPPPPTKLSRRFSKRNRTRSNSAPPLAWLLPRSKSISEPIDVASLHSAPAVLTVRYVAEHHENLQHVLVFLGVEGMPPGHDLEADVPFGTGDTSGGDKLILRCGASSSVQLSLPVRVIPGRKDVRVQSGHFEVKLATSTAESLARVVYDNDSPAPLDASQLTDLAPTSFICSSCSLPLLQSSGTTQFLDLPSDHWSELLDAWMCHTDQKLNSQIAQHGQGFWPKSKQALVGGSYVLFDESSVVLSNTRRAHKATGEEWHRIGCICGAIVGRSMQRILPDNTSSTTYRFAKYAIRPVSPTAEPCRLPFSAFILEDMIELVQAHASHRFLLLDEEEEKPRLLIWLFKPNMLLSYATTAQYALPQSGSIRASKVLFKILGPESACSDIKSILDKYPGFPQAERLLYPLDICRRLAGLLKESNTSYPIGMRVMTGLLVGWLHRS